ncbi:etoposide-induced protein 2.4-domain-containing protein [Tribonema minus]|uniref:Etoposide-induced protein 2.4-domain-containing protein n=1 Tax=Tribonema minus TaxID=303371 RepID=A0A835YNT4_9STRA|nr:etoposide-induced protein 2.4-domain-containing protein [Tribonema minus]
MVLEWANDAFRLYWTGVQDALNVYWPAYYAIKSEKIRKASSRCIVLNGVLFIGSIVLLHSGLLPLLHKAGGLVLGARGDVASAAHTVVEAAVGALYQAFWITPLYLISLLMNTIWYSRIADAAFELHHGVKVAVGVDVTIKEGMYRALVLVFYVLESVVAYQALPVVGPLVSTVLVCWMNALYSFESVWTMQGLDLQKRLLLIERHWPYFMGFGTPVALVSSFWSTFIGLGVFAVCFPACLIQATCSTFGRPDTVDEEVTGLPAPRLPIFRLSTRCSDAVLRGVNDVVSAKKRR